MAEKATPLGPVLDIQGVVSGYVVSQQAGEQVLQFVIEPTEGQLVPVELRGEKIRGVISEGHQVALAAPRDLDKRDDRTLRPLKLKNLSTGGLVEVERPGLRKKALRAGVGTIKEAGKSAIGGLVAIAIGAGLVALGWAAQPKSQEFAPSQEPSLTLLLLIELGWIFVSALVVYFLIYRRWRWQGGSLPTLAILELSLGGAAFIALLWWLLF